MGCEDDAISSHNCVTIRSFSATGRPLRSGVFMVILYPIGRARRRFSVAAVNEVGDTAKVKTKLNKDVNSGSKTR